MKNILIVATEKQRFLDQVQFANKISNLSIEINIYFFIADDVYNKYKNIIDDLKYVIINPLKLNISVDLKKRNLYKNFLISLLSYGFKNKLKKYLLRFNNTKLFAKKLKNQEYVYLNHLNKRYDVIFQLVDNYKIDLFIINGDRHLGDEPIFLKISKYCKIPTIIPYLVDFADEERIFHNDVITKKIKPNIFTSQYIIESQKNLRYKIVKESYYYPHVIGNALQKFGVITSNPYVMGSGDSNILCLNNQHYKELYIKNGVKKDKIKVIGDGAYDNLYAQNEKKISIRNEIMQNYHLDYDKKIILIALPQLGEHNILPWDKHWEEINFLVESCNKLEQNILISLHPKMNRDSYLFLEKKYNCQILNERLSDVLVVADVFVATYSSTVVWAILCSINTIVIDFYGLNYTMYDFLNSIKKIDNKEKLASTLETVINEEINFSDDWKKLSKNEVFDGKTTQRYIDLINEVIKS